MSTELIAGLQPNEYGTYPANAYRPGLYKLEILHGNAEVRTLFVFAPSSGEAVKDAEKALEDLGIDSMDCGIGAQLFTPMKLSSVS